MRIVIYFGLLLVSGVASAQYQLNPWLHVDYTYNQFTYKESAMNEKAQLAGVRGELGLNLAGFLAISAQAEYADGHTNYDGATFGGTPIKQVTNDYLGDLRALAHLIYGPVVVAAGIGERYWMNNLVVSYRRRTTYKYTPVQVTYFTAPFYVRFESDIWSSGHNTSYMSDVSKTEHDVNFKLGNGTGLGAEVGVYLPSTTVQTHIFLRYHSWTVKQSDVQNDGIYNLVEPDNSTTELVGGIGVAF